jgi:hypothetical protein
MRQRIPSLVQAAASIPMNAAADPAPRTLPQLESPQLLLDTIREFTESHAADEPG